MVATESGPWGDVAFGLLASLSCRVPLGGEIVDFFGFKIELFHLRFQRAQKISKIPTAACMAEPNVCPGQGKNFDNLERQPNSGSLSLEWL